MKPKVTLGELVAELNVRAVRTRLRVSVWRLLRDEAAASKKPARKTGLTSPGGGCAGKRTWASSMPPGSSSIDETWAKTNMTGSHGRCVRGQRLLAKAGRGSTNLIDASHS